MKKNLQTEAGQTSSKSALVDSINQSFALFKRNYHNQFFKAFANEEDVVAVKRLWLDALNAYSFNVVATAAHNIVKSSEFLPTLKTMLDHCERASNRKLPEPHAAYAEACCASSPKQDQSWSHPAVYYAGRKIGWHFLQSNAEHIAFPVFKEAYLSLCEQVRSGEQLEMPTREKIEHEPSQPASESTKEKYLGSLKSLLDE